MSLFAILFQALHTGRTMLAGVHHAADPHVLANVEPGNCRANADDSTNDFVSGDDGVKTPAPIIASHMQVRVTYPAIENFDFDIIRTGITTLKMVGRQRCACRLGGKAQNFYRHFGSLGNVLLIVNVVPYQGFYKKRPVARRICKLHQSFSKANDLRMVVAVAWLCRFLKASAHPGRIA